MGEAEEEIFDDPDIEPVKEDDELLEEESTSGESAFFYQLDESLFKNY